MSVKEITPLMSDQRRRTLRASPRTVRTDTDVSDVNLGHSLRHRRPTRLTDSPHMRHNSPYDGGALSTARSQSRDVAGARRGASPPRDGPRPAVWVARVFRSTRSRAGEIRNAPARRGRPPLGHAHDRRLRLFSADLLSSAGGVQGARPPGLGATQARAAR